MANEVAEVKQPFSVALTEKLDAMGDVFAKDFNKPRFVQNAIALLNEKPELVKDFGQAQVMAGLARGAILGLDFFNHECYLVGYGKTLNYQTSYIGQQKLLKKYSIRPVKDIYAELVREGDEFEMVIREGKKSVNFKPVPFNTKPVVGAFAVCEFVDGGFSIETMSIEELENVRKASKMGNAGAWKQWPGEMQKKSVIRRLCKTIEIDFENAQQREIFNADTDIETDPKNLRDKAVSESANAEDFDMEMFDVEAKVIE